MDPAPLDPWVSLAQQARWLADAAERVAQLDPADRLEIDTDELDMLDTRALNVRSVVATCRRHTYQKLRDEGWSVADIAAGSGSSIQAIYKIFGQYGQKRSRGSERPAQGGDEG